MKKYRFYLLLFISYFFATTALLSFEMHLWEFSVVLFLGVSIWTTMYLLDGYAKRKSKHPKFEVIMYAIVQFLNLFDVLIVLSENGTYDVFLFAILLVQIWLFVYGPIKLAKQNKIKKNKQKESDMNKNLKTIENKNDKTNNINNTIPSRAMRNKKHAKKTTPSISSISDVKGLKDSFTLDKLSVKRENQDENQILGAYYEVNEQINTTKEDTHSSTAMGNSEKEFLTDHTLHKRTHANETSGVESGYKKIELDPVELSRSKTDFEETITILDKFISETVTEESEQTSRVKIEEITPRESNYAQILANKKSTENLMEPNPFSNILNDKEYQNDKQLATDIVEKKEFINHSKRENYRYKIFLKSLLDAGTYSEAQVLPFAQSDDKLVRPYINEVNKFFYDEIDDQLIIEENNQFTIDDYYREDVKEWIENESD